MTNVTEYFHVNLPSAMGIARLEYCGRANQNCCKHVALSL